MADEGRGPKQSAWKSSLLAGAGGIAVGALAVGGYHAWRGPDRAATEAIVHDYVIDHGEILQQAVDRMQQRQASPHTICSYRDTFRQFLKFVQHVCIRNRHG